MMMEALGFGFLGGGGAHSGRESWGMRKTCKLEDVGHRGKLVSESVIVKQMR